MRKTDYVYQTEFTTLGPMGVIISLNRPTTQSPYNLGEKPKLIDLIKIDRSD